MNSNFCGISVSRLILRCVTPASFNCGSFLFNAIPFVVIPSVFKPSILLSCPGNEAIFWVNPTGIYLFKVNNGNTIRRFEICSKLTIKTPEWHQWGRSGVFMVNSEHIKHLFPVFYCWLWTSTYVSWDLRYDLMIAYFCTIAYNTTRIQHKQERRQKPDFVWPWLYGDWNFWFSAIIGEGLSRKSMFLSNKGTRTS